MLAMSLAKDLARIVHYFYAIYSIGALAYILKALEQLDYREPIAATLSFCMLSFIMFRQNSTILVLINLLPLLVGFAVNFLTYNNPKHESFVVPGGHSFGFIVSMLISFPYYKRRSNSAQKCQCTDLETGRPYQFPRTYGRLRLRKSASHRRRDLALFIFLRWLYTMPQLPKSV